MCISVQSWNLRDRNSMPHSCLRVHQAVTRGELKTQSDSLQALLQLFSLHFLTSQHGEQTLETPRLPPWSHGQPPLQIDARITKGSCYYLKRSFSGLRRTGKFWPKL